MGAARVPSVDVAPRCRFCDDCALEVHMRLFVLLATLSFVALPAVTRAQEWAEFKSVEDGFRVDFPGQPTVEAATYISEFGYPLPARVYRASRGRERYSMTVVDYRGIEALGKARVASCPVGAEPCRGSMNTGEGYWKLDVGGAIVHAIWTYVQRDVKVTHMGWSWNDLVEGQSLQLENLADRTHSFVHVALHLNRLYILDATVPNGYPAPGLFQQSMGYIDQTGAGIRYQYVYNNRFPPPPRLPADTGVDPQTTGSGR